MKPGKSKVKSGARAKRSTKSKSKRKAQPGAAAARALVESLPVKANRLSLKTPKLDTGSPIAMRATQLEKVCRTTTSVSSCKVPTRGKLTAKVKWRELGIEGSTDEARKAKLCRKAGGTYVPSKTKPIAPGKMELDFLSSEQARKLGLSAPGAYLRLCRTDDERGYLVPVKGPSDARALAAKFRNCVRGDKKRMPMCAAKEALKAWPRRKAPPLGDAFGGAFGGLLEGAVRR